MCCRLCLWKHAHCTEQSMRSWIVCGSPIQWKHAHCTEQSMRRWIVCGSPGVFLCSTGWQSLGVSPLSVTELLDHRRFPQICLNESCFALGTALRGIRIGTALWGIRSLGSGVTSAVGLHETPAYPLIFGRVREHGTPSPLFP